MRLSFKGRLMENLEGRKVEKEIEAAYPPILDEDPTYAAQFLCKEDLDIYYMVLKNTLSSLNGDCDFPILKNSIKFSKKNFEWFMTFFREMEILKKEDFTHFDIPELTFPETSLDLQPPFYVENNKIYYDKIKIRNNTDNYTRPIRSSSRSDRTA